MQFIPVCMIYFLCLEWMVFEYSVPDVECNTEARWSELSLDRDSVANEK